MVGLRILLNLSIYDQKSDNCWKKEVRKFEKVLRMPVQF